MCYSDCVLSLHAIDQFDLDRKPEPHTVQFDLVCIGTGLSLENEPEITSFHIFRIVYFESLTTQPLPSTA